MRLPRNGDGSRARPWNDLQALVDAGLLGEHRRSVWLVDRLFGGRVAPLVAHFSEQRKLTRADIDELRKLIEGFDDGR